MVVPTGQTDACDKTRVTDYQCQFWVESATSEQSKRMAAYGPTQLAGNGCDGRIVAEAELPPCRGLRGGSLRP
jgi:hypothetical protein